MVRDVRFHNRWRGYDTDEVDEFLDNVAHTLQRLFARIDGHDAPHAGLNGPEPSRVTAPQDGQRGPELSRVIAARQPDEPMAGPIAEAGMPGDVRRENVRRALDQLAEVRARLWAEQTGARGRAPADDRA